MMHAFGYLELLAEEPQDGGYLVQLRRGYMGKALLLCLRLRLIYIPLLVDDIFMKGTKTSEPKGPWHRFVSLGKSFWKAPEMHL